MFPPKKHGRKWEKNKHMVSRNLKPLLRFQVSAPTV